MTPLASFLLKYFPKELVGGLLIVIYTLTMLAIFTLMGRVPDEMLYLDVG